MTACNAMHDIAVAILSVCPSDACIMTKYGYFEIFAESDPPLCETD